MSSTELEKRKQEEYEMQLFNFHSRAVYATLQNIISERIQCSIEKLCGTLQKTYEFDSLKIALLKKNERHLIRAYYKAALSHLPNIENAINKYIAVPKHVLLEEDRLQRTQYSESEFETMKEKLEDLQQRAKRATILNTMLKEELEILEHVEISESEVHQMCNVIENSLNCTDINDKVRNLVEDYKHFSKNVFGATSVTEKVKYNTVDNLKCKDINFCNL